KRRVYSGLNVSSNEDLVSHTGAKERPENRKHDDPERAVIMPGNQQRQGKQSDENYQADPRSVRRSRALSFRNINKSNKVNTSLPAAPRRASAGDGPRWGSTWRWAVTTTIPAAM